MALLLRLGPQASPLPLRPTCSPLHRTSWEGRGGLLGLQSHYPMCLTLC